MNFYIYDLETMRNCFLYTGKFEDDPRIFTFEISPRVNQRTELLQHLGYLRSTGVTQVGYNNLQFDYTVIHALLNNPYTFSYEMAYLEAQKIIHEGRFGRANPHTVRMSERMIPQVDLMKINHFDNVAKITSLKALQFAMRSDSIEDLPFPFDTELTSEQMDLMRQYNVHDVVKTEMFFKKCKHLILMRKELLDNGVLTGDVLNYSDVKIGTEYLIKKIGRAKCFLSGSKPRQSLRQSVRFGDIILPKVCFRTERYQAVLDWFKQQTIWIGKDDRPKLSVNLAGLDFHFGVGGVHASVENRRFRSDSTHVIKDIDVSGMYVAVAIANGFAPEHLGSDFVTAYRQLQADRAQHKKGSVMNLVLKLAGNGVFGNSNNPYSPFYDPKYTFSVTVNGQLQVVQLVELLSLVPGVELIQANTDGITALVPREVEHFFNLWCSEWEAITGLKLEHVEYEKMFIRDVNNYIAVTKDGTIKRKGAYWYPLSADDYHGSSGSNWNKDFSNLTAQKGAEYCMIYGHKPEDVVRLFTDPFDFMLRYKTPAGAKLQLGDQEMPKTLRYYVSHAGQPLKKVSQPKGEIGTWKRKNGITDDFYQKVLAEVGDTWDERIHTKNKSKYATVTTAVESGWLVKECNHTEKFNWGDLNYDYYAEEIRKLLIGVPHAV